MSNVKTISFKGRPYVMVSERIRQVHEQKHEFEVLDSSFQEIAGRVLCKVTILVDGKKFTGNAEAKIANAAPKSADETNPLECAETSALGRALAFANFGTVDGIASLDEIARSMTPEQIRAATQSAPDTDEPARDLQGEPVGFSLIEEARRQWTTAYGISNEAVLVRWPKYLVYALGRKYEDSELTAAHLARLNEDIAKQKRIASTKKAS